MTVVHIAGAPTDDVQRCARCGCILTDNRGSDGTRHVITDTRPGTRWGYGNLSYWATGATVGVDGWCSVLTSGDDGTPCRGDA